MARISPVHLFINLILVQEIQTSFENLSSEGRLHAVPQDFQKRYRSFRDPVLAPDKHGHYRHQHKPEESLPQLVAEEGKDNSSQIVDIDYYYTSKIYGSEDASSKYLWVDIGEMGRKEWKTLHFLSNTHRPAERVNLSFSFPFYGHVLKEITVATGGFIYTGHVIHQMLTATQYIAPLMGNFNPSLSKTSAVLYYDNGTALVVQWDQVPLQDNIAVGTFTFQATLHSDGRIVFAYKEIPVVVTDISFENHPVKVGLSDAFVVLHNIDQIHNVRRRTIYEYHTVNIPKSKIGNSTAVEMLPLPTCLQFSSCGPCVTSQIGFNCSWCSRLQRCSSGFDRNRQEWVDLGCPEERRDPRCLPMKIIRNGTSDNMNLQFPLTPTTKQQRISNVVPTPFGKTPTTNNLSLLSNTWSKNRSSEQQPTNTSADDGNTESTEKSRKAMPGGLLATIIGLITALLAAVLLFTYTYNHPTSSISLFLMERRPTHWPILKFRRGSGRPSYAEVEPPGRDREGSVIIDLKQFFVISDRRESEQKEGFVVPDQRERFLASESS